MRGQEVWCKIPWDGQKLELLFEFIQVHYPFVKHESKQKGFYFVKEIFDNIMSLHLIGVKYTKDIFKKTSTNTKNTDIRNLSETTTPNIWMH